MNSWTSALSPHFITGLLATALIHPGLAAAADSAPVTLPPPARQAVDFRHDIYPLLKVRCFKCHRGEQASSGYRLDLRAELLGETNGRPLVRIGDSGQSRLIQLVVGVKPDEVMPPRGTRLTAEQVGLLRAWIDQGLKWDDALLPPARVSTTHWAFQPVARPPVPRVKNTAWVRNPVDAFIAARHEAQGLTPAPEAARRTLLRRLALDLTGLPPTPEDIDAFVADPAPDAYERRVERLLASPHYGERWGRHWLDVARWAESEGYESNYLRSTAWRYRDYVVGSFNRDKPYDRFVREQVAGDELTPYSDENLIATGFLAGGRLSSNEEDKALQRNDVLVDVVNATGNALLGLTVNCCQCHNHKFDPLTARDYYRFMGFFVHGQPANLALKDPGLWTDYLKARPAEYEPAKQLLQTLYGRSQARLIDRAESRLSAEAKQARATPPDRRTPRQEQLAVEADLKLQFNPGQVERAIPEEDRKLYGELKKKIEAIEKHLPDKPQTLGFYAPASASAAVEVLPMRGIYPLSYAPEDLAGAHAYLLTGGDAHRHGPKLDAGWPAVFGPVPAGAVDRKPRLALADWLTRPEHPLTARVWVNRLWHYHFGRGLVATPNDFGTRGAPPTHPELLDWLAGELVRSGWSTKHLHRLIVCSSTYRQSAQLHAANAKLDPENTLWWHWTPRRLEAEAIRDALLAVSGDLDWQVGGPGLLGRDEERLAARNERSRRRSLYLFQKREEPPAVQALFDGPAGVTESCPRRFVSTVPLQALYLLNNDFALRRAGAFARRVREEAGPDRRRQIEVAFRRALGRDPDDADLEAAERFFRDVAAEAPSPALLAFCQALFNLNEFVYLE